MTQRRCRGAFASSEVRAFDVPDLGGRPVRLAGARADALTAMAATIRESTLERVSDEPVRARRDVRPAVDRAPERVGGSVIRAGTAQVRGVSSAQLPPCFPRIYPDPEGRSTELTTGVRMPLSEYEQRVLEQMERQLTTDDPRLANTLTQRGHRPFTRYVVAGVGAAVGLLLLVVGAANSLPWLGVIGFVVMFAAVAYVFAAPQRATRSGPRGVVQSDGQVKSAKPRARGKSGFMARLEERWERRRGESGR